MNVEKEDEAILCALIPNDIMKAFIEGKMTEEEFKREAIKADQVLCKLL